MIVKEMERLQEIVEETPKTFVDTPWDDMTVMEFHQGGFRKLHAALFARPY